MQSSSQIIITNKRTPNFLQAGCPSCHPMSWPLKAPSYIRRVAEPLIRPLTPVASDGNITYSYLVTARAPTGMHTSNNGYTIQCYSLTPVSLVPWNILLTVSNLVTVQQNECGLVAEWLGSFRSTGHGFESRLSCYQVQPWASWANTTTIYTTTTTTKSNQVKSHFLFVSVASIARFHSAYR